MDKTLTETLPDLEEKTKDPVYNGLCELKKNLYRELENSLRMTPERISLYEELKDLIANW